MNCDVGKADRKEGGEKEGKSSKKSEFLSVCIDI